MHEVPLADATLGPADRIAAEAVPPASLDRLWEQEHSGETAFLIASESGGRQSFQTVAADVRVQWRVGLSDAAALDAAYRIGRSREAGARARRAGRSRGRWREARSTRCWARSRTGSPRCCAPRCRPTWMRRIAASRSSRSWSRRSIRPRVRRRHITPFRRPRSTPRARGRANAGVRRRRARKDSKARRPADRRGRRSPPRPQRGARRRRVVRGRPRRRRCDRTVFVLERYYEKLAAALHRVPTTIIDSRIAPADAPVLDLRPPGAGGAIMPSHRFGLAAVLHIHSHDDRRPRPSRSHTIMASACGDVVGGGAGGCGWRCASARGAAGRRWPGSVGGDGAGGRGDRGDAVRRHHPRDHRAGAGVEGARAGADRHPGRPAAAHHVHRPAGCRHARRAAHHRAGLCRVVGAEGPDGDPPVPPRRAQRPGRGGAAAAQLRRLRVAGDGEQFRPRRSGEHRSIAARNCRSSRRGCASRWRRSCAPPTALRSPRSASSA